MGCVYVTVYVTGLTSVLLTLSSTVVKQNKFPHSKQSSNKTKQNASGFFDNGG